MLNRLAVFLLLRHSGVGRYSEVDTLRGLAIGLMICYHAAYDLTLFNLYRTSVVTGAWRVFGRIPAIMFLGLAGISIWLSYARLGYSSKGWESYQYYLIRGLKLLGWGAIITLASWAYAGQPVILFGILHLLGSATMLAFPFVRLPARYLIPGALACIGLGWLLNALPVAYDWLLWLGLRSPNLFQFDYFPLLPWFGLVLAGVAAGRWLYPCGQRRPELAPLAQWPGVQALAWLGQRSLLIYLLHQPLLLGALSLVSYAAHMPIR